MGRRRSVLLTFPMSLCSSACESAATGWSTLSARCSATARSLQSKGAASGCSTEPPFPRLERMPRKTAGYGGFIVPSIFPAERFSFIELSDEKGGERLDRTPFTKGDIAIADRGFLHPEPLAHVLEQGADVIVRAPWSGARWLGEDGQSFDLLAALTAAEGTGILDTPIWIGRKKAPPLALRLVAFRKPKEAAEASRAKARQAAQQKAKPSPAVRWPQPDGLSW